MAEQAVARFVQCWDDDIELEQMLDTARSALSKRPYDGAGADAAGLDQNGGLKERSRSSGAIDSESEKMINRGGYLTDRSTGQLSCGS